MLVLAVILFGIALLLFWLAWRERKVSGIPAGRVIYADTQSWQAVKEPLYDAELGLTGKPDYLVQHRDQIIPVEVKKSKIGGAPFDSHIYQLVAYCWLVYKTYGKRPAYGILHYDNRTFAVDYTSQVEIALHDLLAEIRTNEHKKEAPRSHDSPQRCRYCGYRSTCDQKLEL